VKKRRLAAAVAVLIFLCACGGTATPQAAPTPETPAARPSPENLANRQATEIVFAVSRDASDTLTNAAKHFAAELEARTNGVITVRVEQSIAPDADLLVGRAQIALLNKRMQLEFCAPLEVTATPFLYNGYNNFLMRANAGNVMSILEFALREDHGLVPLAAFYQGAKHLLIDFSPGGYQHFDSMTIITSEDDAVRASFGRLVGLGGETIPFDTDEARMESFLFGDGNAVEISLERLTEIEEDFSYQVHLIASYHNLVPAWLVACAEFIDGLSPLWRAELLELCAYMAHQINDVYRSVDNELLRTISDLPNVTVVFGFSHVRNRVFHTLPGLGEEADSGQRLARDLLEIMRRTA